MTETRRRPGTRREGQRRAVPINATLAPGVDLRQAMESLERCAAERLPGSMGIHYMGEAATLNETASGVGHDLGFALVVVLLVPRRAVRELPSRHHHHGHVPFGLAAAIFAIALSGGR
jgi:HAE1 family hydrophobic/amphiphilic exporter-1